MDAMWGMERPAVEVELKDILGADASAQGHFEQRNAAAKRVYENMDESGKKRINDEVKKRKEEGNEPEIREKWVKSIRCRGRSL